MTPLYEEIIRTNDAALRAVLQDLWLATPWVINVKSGKPDEESYRELWGWLSKTFGEPDPLINGRAGEWRLGRSTLSGYTWLGFATEKQLRQVKINWPHLIGPDVLPPGLLYISPRPAAELKSFVPDQSSCSAAVTSLA